MKNLKSLYLKNFQSHKDTRLDFHEKITMLIGETDTGKTSALRGIRLIVKNEPKGDAFISVGATKATAGLILEDDTEIVREKSKSINRYSIYHPDGTNDVYEKFGIHVPPQVLETLDYEPIFIDEDLSIDLNFSAQLEGPFLISENNATKAKIIDGLAKINVFNMGLRKTKAELNNISGGIKNGEKELAVIETDLAAIDNIEGIELQLGQTDYLIETLTQKEQKLQSLLSLKAELDRINNQIEIEKKICADMQNINQAENVLNQLMLVVQKFNIFAQSANALHQIQQERENNLHILAYKDRILTAEKHITEIDSKMATLNQYQNLNTQYNQTKERIDIGVKYVSEMSVVHKLEEMVSLIEGKMNKLGSLNSLQNQLGSIQREIELNKQTISDLSELPNSENILSSLEDKMTKFSQLNQLNTTYLAVQGNIAATNSEIKSLVNVSKASDIISKLEDIIVKSNNLSRLKNDNEMISIAIQKEVDEISKQKEVIASETEAYTNALKESNTCPLCFNELDEKHLEHIANNL